MTTPVDFTALRLRLVRGGYTPLPLFGKTPPIFGKNGSRKGLANWQKLDNVTPAQIGMWAKTWPDATNTGILTRLVPTLDLDLLNEEAARAAEDLVRKRFEERGRILSRIGKPPKRAIPFFAEESFDKIIANVIAPNGEQEKIEFLGDGQQVVVDGIHPDTKQPYRWHGGEPGQIACEDLAYICEREARQLVDDLVKLLVSDFGYQRAPERSRKQHKASSGSGYTLKANDNGGFTIEVDNNADDWQYLIDNIREGRELHDSLRNLAAKLVKSGMSEGAAINFLRAAMNASAAPHNERWQERYDDIPRLVEGAVELRGETGAEETPSTDVPDLPLAIDVWLKRDLPAPDYLIGNWLTTTSRILFASDTGLGKTNFALAAFTHLAAGRDFLHWCILQPRRVLYVDGEMSRRLLKQRLEDAVRRLDVTPETLHVLSHEDVDGFQPLNTKVGQKYILEVIKSVEAEAVCFDNIMALIAGDMKDEDAWRATLPLIGDLTKQGIGQLWVHHTGHDATRSYGTKTREWRMDTVIHGTAVERPDTDVSFLLEFRKARERTPANRHDFEDVTVALVNDVWIGDVGKAVQPKKASPIGMKFFEALQTAFADNETTTFQSWKAVTMAQWRTECRTRGLIDEGKPDAVRSLMSKYRRELIACNLIACNNDLVWIVRP
jgi:AAA domain/Bifunctional DNA primase/polymerase, N-terminal